MKTVEYSADRSTRYSLVLLNMLNQVLYIRKKHIYDRYCGVIATICLFHYWLPDMLKLKLGTKT